MAAAVLLRWAGQGLYSSVWGLPFGAGLRRRLSLGSSSNGEGGGGSWLYFPLRDRDALRVHGPDTESFLLGLLTNELPRPGPGGGATSEPAPAPAHYAHFLNVQGRTLYDVILYRLQECQEEPHFLLEVDSSVSGAVQNHLKLYKIRRKVSISPCPDLSLWAVLPQTAAEGSAKPSLEKGGKPLVLTPDPRAACMGWRLIIRKEDLAQEVIPKTQIRNSQDYHKYRYQKGIPEGVKDLPPGVALPLESNLTFMNGVSFTKGCYIGQELTARTQHMGVIRKRLFPIRFSAPLPEEGICSGANVLTEAGKPAGKYRAREGDLGIALLRAERIKDPLHIKTSRGQQVSVVPSVPDWWPQASK
ncbi:putative transferase CAF17, mitochondrial isoform X1 [Gracilinanus agilis]|uniref:putative transferase CAF17, mitochondrial isoform X1 n=1 Tax=Gracilinanus agilis TaxID=191870 RepID=UPI001CFD033D|nr:putative transferase CAF17, mitochondrial isoform X1 [Gracilinanus agilis]